jgi:inner membrane transporter RhtA
MSLVMGAVASVQLGAAVATTLFDELGPAGTVLLRTGFAAVALLLLWRPGLRGRARGALRDAVL